MKLRYTNTTEDYIAFQKYHQKTNPLLKRFYRLSLAILILFVLVTQVMARHQELGLANSIFIGIILAFLSGIFFLVFCKVSTFFLRRMSARSMLKGEKQRFLCEHVLEITDTELVEKTDIGMITTKLSAIENVCDTEGYTFIYISPQAAHVLPEARISEGDYRDFVAHLRYDAGMLSHRR